MNIQELKKSAGPKMLTAGMDKESISRELSFAAQIISGSNYLQNCDPMSILSSVVNVANTGLTLNPVLNQAYLVPRKGKCVLDPSYAGLIFLALQSDNIVNMVANVVYENDDFSIDLAANLNPVSHKPTFKKDKGELLGSYAVAYFENGTSQVEWVNYDDLMKIRSGSESWKAFQDNKTKQAVWSTWFDQMCRKAPIKRLCKYLGSSNKKLFTAVEIDNRDFGSSLAQQGLIESLLMTAEISEAEGAQIFNRIPEMSFHEAKETIIKLKGLQTKSPIQMNGYGTAKELDVAIADAVNNPRK